MQTITITVAGGLIQDIDGIPKDVEVIVKDFDCDEEEGINVKYENGDNYWETIWIQ